MSADEKVEGCVASAAGPDVEPAQEAPAQGAAAGKEKQMHVSVGMEAPDFEAMAYHEGGFENIRLSDHRGKWVFLCFYPGDFTFV
jgi:hypothetical protein